MAVINKNYSFFARSLLLAAGLLLLQVGGSYARPTVIKDDRIRDLASTPVLGRGYSIATNTYQSTCLTNVVVTEPSYDFTYIFKSIERTTTGGIISQMNPESYTAEFVNELLKKSKRTRFLSKAGEAVLYTHRIMVTIDLHSYYASLDEAAAILSPSAGRLLTQNDIPGFFSSCGSYYIRSIGRNAKFVALFTYMTREPVKDEDFENEVERQINGFAKDIATSVGSKATTRPLDYEFKKKAGDKKLTITFAAFGLGKNEKATLISYDIESFRKALKDAFLAMQNPRTGKVKNIEVIPWVENTQFQALIRLGKKTVKPAKGEEKPRELLMYEKKQILNLNAEFLAEIERVDRGILELYYKAKICRDHIDTNWKSGGRTGAIKANLLKSQVVNNDGGKSIPLSKLNGYLTEELIEGILERERNFMYGGGAGNAGAASCMKEIMKQGIFTVPYREIEACRQVQKKLLSTSDEMIENYCMPRIADFTVEEKNRKK